MKKLVALGMALTMVMSILTGCGGSASSSAASSGAASSDAASGSSASSDFNVPAGAKVVKFGNAGAIGEPAPETCQYFCDMVNEKIGDRYYFEFYPAEQLGNETTMLENIQVGLQEGVMTSLDTLASYESDLNILSMAFAFDSYEDMIAYLKSDLGASIWESLDNQGMHVVNFEFKKNPRAMGAMPTVVSWSEFPFALMQGVVDGGECSKDSYRSAGLYESAKYVADVDYAYPVEQICFSTQFWNSLSADDQKVIEDCAADAAAKHTEKIADRWEEDKEWLVKEGGVTFCDIDRQAFIDAAAPLGKELQDEGFFATPNLYDETRQFNSQS